MTIEEILNLIERNEDQFMGKKICDTAHIIEGFEVVKKSDGTFEINLLGMDGQSGVPVVTKKLEDWFKDNNLELL